jgi:DNA recombination-dependent growth factor C
VCVVVDSLIEEEEKGNGNKLRRVVKYKSEEIKEKMTADIIPRSFSYFYIFIIPQVPDFLIIFYNIRYDRL